jgi:hypothetical protein
MTVARPWSTQTNVDAIDPLARADLLALPFVGHEGDAFNMVAQRRRRRGEQFCLGAGRSGQKQQWEKRHEKP